MCATQLAALRYGDATVVVVELARLADTLAGGDPAAMVVSQSLTYLAKPYEQIQYAAFTARGYPIGSGIVEGANKLVVEARLKGAGMHRAPATVNPLLALRSAACRDRWDAAWPAITGQRRHGDRLRSLHRNQRLARRSSRPPHPPRPPRVVNARPTSDHPWRRFHLRGSRSHAKL